MQETQEMQVLSLGWEDPLEEEISTHSSILAGKFQGQRSLAGYSPWGHKESDTTKQLSMQSCYHSKNVLYVIATFKSIISCDI